MIYSSQIRNNSNEHHNYHPRIITHTCYRKASQSPIPSWATNQQVLIIFFCAYRNKGEGAPAISDLVQRENNGTGYWIVNMSDSYFGRQQYVIYRPISRLCKWSRTGGQNNNKKWCLAPKGLNFLCFVLQLRYIFTDMKRVYCCRPK